MVVVGLGVVAVSWYAMTVPGGCRVVVSGLAVVVIQVSQRRVWGIFAAGNERSKLAISSSSSNRKALKQCHGQGLSCRL